MDKVKQRVIRTYANGWTRTTESLSEALRDGYNVVIATPFMKNGNTEYTEYIVQKSED